MSKTSLQTAFTIEAYKHTHTHTHTYTHTHAHTHTQTYTQCQNPHFTPTIQNFDSCMTQTIQKLHLKIRILVKNIFLNGVKCHELKFQSPSLETAFTTELPTIDELQKSTVITPGEKQNLKH